MSKLDMADTYPPAEHFDDEPTIRVHMPNFFPKVIVDGESYEGERDTIPAPSPYPHPHEETRYPGYGLIIALTIGVAFWFLPAYYMCVYLLSH